LVCRSNFAIWLSVLGVLIISACGGRTDDRVTVYVAADREIAEPVLREFEKSTGITVSAVYDAEANKTSGLVNRLIAEAPRARADLFWDNETAQLTRLNDVGVIAHTSVDRNWEEFAARARVLIVHHMEGARQEEPTSIGAFTDPQWKGRAAIANPHFGSTGMHFAALLSVWGEPRFRAWVRELRRNDVAVLPGNAQVKDAVAAGKYDFGLTDTDDVNEALRDGKAVHLVVPDQGATEIGVLVIPNAIALVRGGPHAENARKLMRYLLSPEVEAGLAKGDSVQIPIRNSVPGPSILPPLATLRLMRVDYEQVGKAYRRMLELVDAEWQS